MFPWITEFDPPLKLLVSMIPKLEFPEIRLRSSGFGPPIVTPTVPPWVKPIAMPVALPSAARPAASVPRKLPAITMPVALDPNGMKSSTASAQRLMMRPRTTASSVPMVMQRFGAVVPSISICRTVFRAPVAFVLATLPGWV